MPVLVTDLDQGSPSDLLFTISKGATLPKLQMQVVNQEKPVDITGATVVFSMEDGAGVPKVTNQAGVIEDALNGIVSYSWAAADVDTPGTFFGQFKITDSGRDYRVPTGHGEKLVIEVSASLAFV